MYYYPDRRKASPGRQKSSRRDRCAVWSFKTNHAKYKDIRLVGRDEMNRSFYARAEPATRSPSFFPTCLFTDVSSVSRGWRNADPLTSPTTGSYRSVMGSPVCGKIAGLVLLMGLHVRPPRCPSEDIVLSHS